MRLCSVCSSWDGSQGPVKDVYSLANNPQYKLEVQCPTGGAAVWVLLTRHITDKVGAPTEVLSGVIYAPVFYSSSFLSRMILHKTGSSSLWLFTRRRGRRFTTQVRMEFYCRRQPLG